MALQTGGSSGGDTGSSQRGHMQGLASQGFLYNLTLDEVQNHLGEPLLEMNFDELLKSVFPDGVDPDDVGTGKPDLMSSLEQQGSVMMPPQLISKTVDEVWKGIQDARGTSAAEGGWRREDRQPTLGEMTLEEFLIRAGIVREDMKDSGVFSSNMDSFRSSAMAAGTSGLNPRAQWLQQYQQQALESQQPIMNNTESSARSRAWKQAYNNELENKVSHLEEDNEMLKKQKMSQPVEDIKHQVSELLEMCRGGEDGEEANVVVRANGDTKEIIDCDANEGDGKHRKEIAARSTMWHHFTKIKENGVVIKGNCNYCNHDIQAHSVFNGTSAMRRHFKSCKHNPNRVIKDAKQGVLQVNEGNNVNTWKFDHELLRTAFCEMVIEDEEPFAFGEKAGFKKFMALACPQFALPSRRTCTRDIVKLYFEQKRKLKIFFQEQCQRVSLTTDCWASQQQDSYMTVTAHFIDNDWCPHKKRISFFKVKDKKGDDIGRHLQKVLLEWGLEKVMTVVVDNASANDSGISYLRKQMNSLKTSIARGMYLYMRCAAHIVNLIVQDGLKEADNSIKRVRAAVRFVKNGASRLVRFKECADLEKVDGKAFLNLDVCTRWNSTHDMLRAACTYEKVFTRYAKEEPYFTTEMSSDKGPGVPEEGDWDNAKKMAEILGHFADVTKRVSTSLSVTAHTLFHEIGEVNILVHNWMDNSNPTQEAIGNRMKEKYDKYWGQWHGNVIMNLEKENENINMLIFVAVVLDPRYKLSEYMEVAIKEIYGEGIGHKVWAALIKCLHDLFEEYMAIYSSPSESDAAPQTSDSQQSEQGEGCARMMKTVVAKRMRLNNGSSTCSRGCQSELDKYLAEECEDNSKKLNILAWWKVSSSRFPVLSRLARDVLAIPISTVASESVFSTSGKILDDFRTSLTPFMLEAVVCTQDWLRRSTPINIAENTEELTKLEEELIKEFKDIAITENNASTSQVIGSKATNNTMPQLSRSSKSRTSKNKSSKA